MKKKTTLQKKLKSYSALAGATALASVGNAQVVYTDIVDVTVNGPAGIYNLDLNNSGSTDFTIMAAGGSSSDLVAATPNTGNAVGATGPAATKLNQNDPINSSSVPWSTTAARILALVDSSSNQIGVWHSAIDKYLPLRIQVGSNTHYGWARLDVDAKAKWFKIKDYAYDATPNQQILAGDKGVSGIADLNISNVKMYTEGKTAVVDLNGLQPKSGDRVSLSNLLGEEVKASAVTSSVTRMDLAGFPTGIYFITLTSEGKAVTKKVYVF